MKESTLATKIMVGVLCAGVLAYLALYFLRGFQNSLVTATAYEYEVTLGTQATGITVREEQVLSGGTGAYVDLLPAEGEKTAAGDAVAMIYSDPSALSTQQTIQSLTLEIQQLERALSSAGQTVDVSRLDQQVTASIANLRALAAGGDLSSLEDSVLNLRTLVFQRAYAFSGGETASQVQQLISDKQDQLDELTRSLSQVSQTVYAPVSGVFSGQADGYEGLITPQALPDLTPEQLASLLSAQAPQEPDALGKLITDSTWYFAALLPGGNDLLLTEGTSYTVSFSHDYYGQVDMTLERVEPGQEQTLAIFSADEALGDTTLLRIQRVNVITDTLEGIRIPRRALRVETEQVEREDGSVTQENTYVVYTVVGQQAERQEVEVLYSGDSFYLVRPAGEEGASQLRAGDEVILSTSDIYDGKVVR